MSFLNRFRKPKAKTLLSPAVAGRPTSRDRQKYCYDNDGCKSSQQNLTQSSTGSLSSSKNRDKDTTKVKGKSDKKNSSKLSRSETFTLKEGPPDDDVFGDIVPVGTSGNINYGTYSRHKGNFLF